jgi:hypothetical protein
MKSVFLTITLLLCTNTRVCLADGNSTDPWDRVQTRTLVSTEVASREYQVTVNGVDVPVSRYQANGVNRAVAVAHFAFSGTARIKVTLSGGIPKGLVISPRSLSIRAEVVGNTVKFAIDRPRKLALHFGGKDGMQHAEGRTEKLFLFADAFEPELPAADGSRVIDAQQAGIAGKAGAFVAA